MLETLGHRLNRESIIEFLFSILCKLGTYNLLEICGALCSHECVWSNLINFIEAKKCRYVVLA